MTASVILFNNGHSPAHLEHVGVVASAPNLEIVGTSAAGAGRHLGQALGSKGYPPRIPGPIQTDYLPVSQVPVPPGAVGHGHAGVDVLLGVRYRSGDKTWFDGVKVTYKVGHRTYTGEFPMSFAICVGQCTPPAYGPPWGP